RFDGGEKNLLNEVPGRLFVAEVPQPVHSDAAGKPLANPALVHARWLAHSKRPREDCVWRRRRVTCLRFRRACPGALEGATVMGLESTRSTTMHRKYTLRLAVFVIGMAAIPAGNTHAGSPPRVLPTTTDALLTSTESIGLCPSPDVM